MCNWTSFSLYFFPCGVQISYVMPFVPCYVLEFLKLLLLLPQVGSRQSTDVCFWLFCHTWTMGQVLARLVCSATKAENWVSGSSKHLCIAEVTQNPVRSFDSGFCNNFLNKIVFGFHSIMQPGRSHRDSEHGGQGLLWSLHRHNLLLLHSCREAELALKYLGIMHRSRRQNGFSQ